ncbi:hypothetical protein FPOA_13748 [Fusarium poae]|uniref:Calpain catalytic domain-containing protein n=1 Tax=Fusarium poae TaxID=36050 RepID=A0A1B8A4L4_FUSPO|nr:hypothetical protein FPOA_13748 [Fusarium poae]
MKFALQPLSTSPHRRSDVDLAMTAFCIVQSSKGNPFARSNVNMYKPLFPSMFLVFWICRPVSIYRHLPTCTVTVHPRSLTTFVGLALNLLSINQIWKKFSKRKFHKALAVLPFDPVQSSATCYFNELLSAGYERTAEECRRKVEKIIKECKRVNMRYRDPGWDLDWDLKHEKGHCLNSLGTQKFELNRTTLLSSKAAVPKAVKRVHEIFEKPIFMKEVSGGDVKQGSLGDCWIMAGPTALASVPEGLQRICVAYDTKIGIYGFVFFRDGEWIYSIIDDKLYLKSPCWDSPSMQRDLLQQIDREDNEYVYRKTYQTGSKALFFAQCRDQNETWVPLFEKAYAKAHGDHASLAGGWIGEGVEDLSGGVTTELLTSDILDIDEFWDKEMSRVNDEFLFGASTSLLEHGYGERNGTIHNPSFATTPLSPGKIKKVPPKLINFTYTKVSLNI